MPFNLSDDGEALDGVLSVFGNDRAALADLLLAVGKGLRFLLRLRPFPAWKKTSVSCAFHAAALLLNKMRLVSQKMRNHTRHKLSYISV